MYMPWISCRKSDNTTNYNFIQFYTPKDNFTKLSLKSQNIKKNTLKIYFKVYNFPPTFEVFTSFMFSI